MMRELSFAEEFELVEKGTNGAISQWLEALKKGLETVQKQKNEKKLTVCLNIEASEAETVKIYEFSEIGIVTEKFQPTVLNISIGTNLPLVDLDKEFWPEEKDTEPAYADSVLEKAIEELLESEGKSAVNIECGKDYVFIYVLMNK